MLTPTQEKDLLDALVAAEQHGDQAAIESAVTDLALFHVFVAENPLAAAPYWRRGAELVAKNTAPDSAELATFLHNMAAHCLIPAGLHEEARATLRSVKKLYAVHFRADAGFVRDVDKLLNEIGE